MAVGRRRSGVGGAVVMGTIYSVLALALVLMACVELGDAATAVDVYRLIQYDLAGAPYGSRLAGFNHHAASIPFAPGSDLSRTVLVAPVRDLNLTLLQDYIFSKQQLGGLLLLLPQKIGNKVDGGNEGKSDGLFKSILVNLENLLIHASIPYPVYFAYENEKIKNVVADIQRGDATAQTSSATNGGYKLVVSSPEPRKVSSPAMINIQGWLPGLKTDGDSSQLPTIAVVASYDTFGAAPALAVGSDSNGSGVVALLEIARLFSRLYNNPMTRGRYNILFGLTSGGPYNYNGTMKWLRSFDQRIRESIDYAICLNSIGSWNNELWLHVSKPPENVYIKQVYESLSEVGTELGVTIGIKHKKINISNSRVAWEHEQFSRSRVTAVTLSELSAPPELLQSTGGLHDTRSSVDEIAIHRSIKLVAESLARHIYGHQGRNIQIFADNSSLSVNSDYVKSLLELLSRTPRVAPFISKTHPIITALKKELSDHTDNVHVQHEIIDGMFDFYDSIQATLNIYQVASVTFDIFLLLVVGSYLFLLFTFLVITTRGLDDLITMFRRPPPRKVKAA